jgi:hypothetical protein
MTPGTTLPSKKTNNKERNNTTSQVATHWKGLGTLHLLLDDNPRPDGGVNAVCGIVSFK